MTWCLSTCDEEKYAWNLALVISLILIIWERRHEISILPICELWLRKVKCLADVHPASNVAELKFVPSSIWVQKRKLFPLQDS